MEEAIVEAIVERNGYDDTGCRLIAREAARMLRDATDGTHVDCRRHGRAGNRSRGIFVQRSQRRQALAAREKTTRDAGVRRP